MSGLDRNDIIRMAGEAGLVRFEGGELEAYGIAKASHDDHSRACWSIADEQRLTRFAALVAATEREACAKVCEDIDNEYEGEDVLAAWCADAIRARIKARTRAPRSRRRKKFTP
jgi:hypothetical protein